MFSLHRLPRLAAVLLSLTVLGTSITACGNRPHVTTLEVDVLLKSQDKNLHKVGTDGRSLYGSNHLVGEGTVGGDKVGVEMQATVDYTDGSGNFDGVITFTIADGSTIGVVMVDGQATAKTDTTSARFSSLLRIIDGTSTYLGASGRGTFAGERMDAIGGAVQSHFVLRVER
jgi:hypothetical protein